MFLLSYICRKNYFGRFIVLITAIIIALLPTLAAAAGETYTWKDNQHTAIEASGGAYAASTEFAKSGNAYTATGVALVCTDGSTGTTTGTSKIVTSGSQYTLDNSGLTTAAGCTSQTLTTPFTVATPAVTTAAASGSCDQGSFTWIACPVMGSLASTIAKLATSALTPFLEITPLKSGSSSSLYTAWSHLRDFSDALFILIFIIVIFSTVIQTGLDQYTVKRLLPRVIAAVILVQFSYFLIGFVVDIGNVLGSGVDSLLITVTDPSSGNHSISNFFGDVGALSLAAAGGAGAFVTLAGTAALLPILLLILLGVFAVFLTLMTRYVILALLIIVAPLAIVAWVLPNTQNYFKKWRTALLRLVMMYPIIIAILSVAGHISQLLPVGAGGLTGTPSILVALVKPLVIVAAFMMVPMTFKWAGASMGGLSKAAGKLAGRASKSYKNSGFWKDGVDARAMNKSQHMLNRANRAMLLRDPDKAQQVLSQNRSKLRQVSDGFIMSSAGRRTQGLRMGARGLALGGAPSTPLALQRSYNTQFNARVKDLTDLENSEATPGNLKTAFLAMYGDNMTERSENMQKLNRSAPTLMRYTTSVQGRAAITRKLSEFSMIDDDMLRRATSDPRAALEYNQFIGNKAAKPNVSGEPTITFARQYDTTSPQKTKFIDSMAANQIRSMGAHGFSETFKTNNFLAAIGKNAGKDAGDNIELYTQDDLSTSIASVILDNASYRALSDNFTAGNRNWMDASKRVAAVRMIKANESLAASGNAKEVRETILTKILDQTNNVDIYDNLTEVAIREGFTNDPLGQLGRIAGADQQVAHAAAWDTHDKEAFLRRWLNF